MISGPEPRRRAVLAALLGVAAGPALAEQDITAPRWDLAGLMEAMAKVRAGTARFTETRSLQLLSAPLVTSGVLRFAAPDRLEKQTLLPKLGLLAVTGDQLLVEQQGQPSRTISLRDAPEIAGLVAALRATLVGDRSTLERYFAVTLSGPRTGWQLELTPRDGRMAKLVASIRISGSFDRLQSVVTLEDGGDRSELTIMAEPG